MNLIEIEELINSTDAKLIKGEYKECEELAFKALEAINKNLDKSDQHTIEKLKLQSELIFGVIAQRKGDYNKSLQIATPILQKAVKLDLKEIIAKTNRLFGLINYSQGNFDISLEHFHKSVLQFEELEHISEIAAVKGNMANVYFNLNEYQKALDAYKEVLETYEKLRNKTGITSIKGNMASTYMMLEDLSKSLELQLEVLELHRKSKNDSSEANSLSNLGNLYLKMGNSSEALKHYNLAQIIYEKLGEKSKIANTIYNLGSLYTSIDLDIYNPELAEKYLIHAIDYSSEIGLKDLIYRSQYRLMTLYRQEKRFEEGLNYYEKFHRSEKEVLSANAKKKAEQLEQERLYAEKEKSLEIERAAESARLFATKTLLHKILPETISDRIVGGENTIFDYFPSTSILFADIVGFTTIASQMNALDVGRFLNYVFGEFDHIMKENGCEKIKTIGDGYMAAAGVPITCEDHADRLIKAAIEMLRVKLLPKEIKRLLPSESSFDFRIGIHSGSVMAGVIGKDRFIYDIFSDAVNLASRMESHGEPGKIHVSSDFKNEIKNSCIKFISRGQISIKGKDDMETFFVVV